MEDELFFPFRNADDPRAEDAEKYFRTAYETQMNGRLDKAAELYKMSISMFPTSEAHTFLGWVYSFQGKLEEAILECKRAIDVDPDFGNPYNDIGAYLIELGRPQEAIPWLQKALKAPRYQPRHFPHVNLARVYILSGDLENALRELQESLRIEPRNPSAERELKRLLMKMN
jgi:Tfp pilus assembly protein PilF